MSRSPSLINVIKAYCSEPSGCRSVKLGDGNINDTYLVKSGDRAFVLQRINSTVFSDPLRVINNFEKITVYLNSGKSPSSRLLTSFNTHVSSPGSYPLKLAMKTSELP